MAEVALDGANLKSLLDKALCQGCGDVADVPNKDSDAGDPCRTQLDLGVLHKLLQKIIEGQTTLLLTAGEQEARIQDLETSLDAQTSRVDDLAVWTERRKQKIADGETTLNKSPLPPIGSPDNGSRPTSRVSSRADSRRESIRRHSGVHSLKNVTSSTSALRMAQASVMNFADKTDLDRINTRISLLQTKLDKLTDIVPTNEQIVEQVAPEKEESTESIKPVQSATESWSKHVLTKRIESNEESLEKFMQLIDDLGSRIKSMQTDLNSQIKQAMSNNASSEQVQSALESIKDILSRLSKMERGMPDFDTLSAKLAKIAKAHEKISSEGDSRHDDLQNSLKNLESMLMALDKQCRNAAQQLSHLQASVAAAAEGKAIAPPPEIQHIEPVRDLETIRALGELSDRVGSLDAKMLGLESINNLGQHDLDMMKATILEEVPVYIDNALKSIHDQLQALHQQNEKLNEIVALRKVREEQPAPEPQPRSRPSSAKIDIDRFASKQQMEQVKESLENSTQNLDDRITKEILSLHDKISDGSSSLWDELEKMKLSYNNFENDLANMRSNILEKASMPAESTVPLKGDSSLADVNTLSPALAALLDRMQKKTYDLGAKLEGVACDLVRVDEDGRLRASDIDSLRSRIERLESEKADKTQIDTLEEKKADRSELAVKVSRDDFDGAISDMQNQLEGLVATMVEQEESWKSSLDQTNARLKKCLNSDDMDAFRRGLEARLKSLKLLLESTRQEEHSGGDCSGDAALFRKPLMGYKCVTCDKVTFPEPGFPVASIPVTGSLPHMHTIRPYTTFDLHNIREQSKLKKTGYEERVWLRMKTNLDRSYRQHVAESMNHAFNAFEQGATETVPIQGGSSIPKSYHIAPAGRSCGGGHTRTNPHVKFTHLKNLADIWQEDGKRLGTPADGPPGDEIANKFEESRREVQILGADGHVYKGRNATHPVE